MKLASSIIYGVLKITDKIITDKLIIKGIKQPRIFVQSTEPSDIDTNDIWIDIS